MSEVSRLLKRLEPYCLYICLLLQAGLLFWRLDLLPVWGDEQVTLDLCVRPLREIAAIVARDVHPPLYYFLVHYWVQLPLSADLIVTVRIFSCLWALATTVVLDRLWLRGDDRSRWRWRFLLLWALSPCAILYGRMARSYTLQLFLGSLALYWGLALLRDPRRRAAIGAYAIAGCLLFYTHYVPALAIVGAVSAMLGYKALRSRESCLAATAPLAIMTVLYLPWLKVLGAAVESAMKEQPYSILPNPIWEQMVRVAYLAFSFSFGETPSLAVLASSVVLAPVLVILLWRERREEWFPVVLIAGIIGYVAVTRVVSFAFTPARLLFILPFYLMLLTKRTWTFAVLACLSVVSLHSYYLQENFLNKGYLLPFDQIADIIQQDSGIRPIQVRVEAPGLDTTPLTRRLAAGTLPDPQRNAEIIWVLESRGVHSAPPGAHEVWRRQFVRFSLLDHLAMKLVNWPIEPTFVLELTKYLRN